jgi:hypothetical protein
MFLWCIETRQFVNITSLQHHEDFFNDNTASSPPPSVDISSDTNAVCGVAAYAPRTTDTGMPFIQIAPILLFPGLDSHEASARGSRWKSAGIVGVCHDGCFSNIATDPGFWRRGDPQRFLNGWLTCCPGEEAHAPNAHILLLRSPSSLWHEVIETTSCIPLPHTVQCATAV